MATPSSETSNVHDDTPQPVHNGNRKEDEVDDSCCWCCGEGDDKFEGEWDVPKEVAFCKWFGTQIVDFREAKWPERVYEHTVKVKARTACGYVKVRSSVRRFRSHSHLSHVSRQYSCACRHTHTHTPQTATTTLSASNTPLRSAQFPADTHRNHPLSHNHVVVSRL
eukprot:m.186423 g.186423  ORF g.186423 m.186423 type:complete len:166 (+) comp24765_c0_seq5:563-1060(+)